MKERIVILGGAGFIGSTIVKKVRDINQSECISLSSKDFDLMDAIKTTSYLVDIIKNSVVVYCAGRHRQRSDTYQTMLDNITMINNVIKAISISKPKHFIFLSSVEIYGAPISLPLTELSEHRPMYLYAVGKATCEHLLRLYCEKNSIKLSILRLPGVYGPTDGKGSIVSKIYEACYGPETFNLIGDGKDLRDFVFVEDLVEIIVRLSYMDKGVGTVNIATGNSLELNEVIRIIAEQFGPCNIKKIESKLNSMHFDLIFDVSVLKSTFPDFKMSSLNEGILAYR